MPFAVAALAVAAPKQEAPWAPDGPSRGEDLEISMATFGPGDDLPSWWGHSALWVKDTRLDEARLYNYGMFGFSTGFLNKFIFGRLEFWVADDRYVEDTLDYYKSLDRDVRIQEFSLTPTERLSVAHALADNVRPQNREYLYHHYRDNCSTRPRDIIDAALAGQLKSAGQAAGRFTLRGHTRRYSSVNVPMSWVLDFIQKGGLDTPTTLNQEAFLPDELERQFDALVVKHDDGTQGPFVKAKKNYFLAEKRAPVPDAPPEWFLMWCAVGAVLGGGSLGLGHLARHRAKWPRRALKVWLSSILTVGGLLGSALFFLAFFTDHDWAHWNENLFFLNPLTLVASFLALRWCGRKEKGAAALKWVLTANVATAVVGLVAKLTPLAVQDNWNIIVVALPWVGGACATLWLDAWFSGKSSGTLPGVPMDRIRTKLSLS